MDLEKGVGHVVVIQARDLTQCRLSAERIGVDFYDSNEFSGDRWSMPWPDDGYDEPLLYGEPLEKTLKEKLYFKDTVAFLHMANGDVFISTPEDRYAQHPK